MNGLMMDENKQQLGAVKPSKGSTSTLDTITDAQCLFFFFAPKSCTTEAVEASHCYMGKKSHIGSWFVF